MTTQTSPDEQPEQAPTAPAAAPAPAPAAGPVAPAEPEAVELRVDAWTHGSARRAITVAGLLADQPELADAELTEADWQTKLDEYLQSPRPAVEPDEQETN